MSKEATERKRREEAFSYAKASVELSGFRISDAYSKEAERFIRGEIDFPTLTAKAHEIDMPEFLKGCSNGASQERQTLESVKHPGLLSNHPLNLTKK